MKRITSLVLGGVLAATLAAAAPATKTTPATKATPATKTTPDPKAAFDRMDTNHDGKLSLQEYVGKNKKNEAARTARFKKLDKNGDGFLTPDEFQSHAVKPAVKNAQKKS